ncbi:MAG: gamma-glutamyltransferase, partial [Gemmatimonadales bacterium]
MRRRTFLATLPAAAAASAVAGPTQAKTVNPNLELSDVHSGDRITGASFASRSTVWGAHGAAATAHPLATLAAIDILRAGGSAVDAAVAANAALGFLEPVSCGIGGDCFAMVWDPKANKLAGLNGSGRSPRSLSLETQRARAKNGYIASFGAVSVSTPGAVDAWWTLHERYGRLKWADVLAPAIELARDGAPVPQTIAYYLEGSYRGFTRPDMGIEEVENFK